MTERGDIVLDPFLGSGSTLVFYTDGLVERRTESIVIGMERLRQACESGPAAADALCKHLAAVMLADGFATDDVAIVVVTVT